MRDKVQANGYRHLSEEDRFWMKVDRKPGCWEWLAHLTKKGYGRFRLGDRMVFAHRVSYEMEVGPIPESLVIDHLCRNRKCVNPKHLEVVSRGENTRRGNTWGKTCRSGEHKIEGPDDYYVNSGQHTYRRCKKCVARSGAASYQKNRGKRLKNMKDRRERIKKNV